MLKVASQRLSELGEVERITSLRKVVGVATLTAFSTKRWLRRSKENARVAPETISGGSQGDRASLTDDPSCHTSTASPSAANVEPQLKFAAEGVPDMAALLTAMSSLQSEVKAMRDEMREMRNDRGA